MQKHINKGKMELMVAVKTHDSHWLFSQRHRKADLQLSKLHGLTGFCIIGAIGIISTGAMGTLSSFP